MLIIKECNHNNLCVDCDNHECLHHGKIECDCPKYICNNEIHDCNKCTFIKEYQIQMRNYYKENTNKGKKIILEEIK